MDLKIKVCGMRNPENIREIAALKPDFMGFIFYDKSPRFVLSENNFSAINELPESIKKVGVFVNAHLDEIVDKVREFSLQAVQLHGDDNLELCQNLKKLDLEVLKVFSIDSHFDFEQTKGYENCAEYFLFDTKTPLHGGSGQRFDWNILKQYQQNVPFLLAGGISSENIDEIKNLKMHNFAGIDINSKFEISPALKNVENVKNLIEKIRNI